MNGVPQQPNDLDAAFDESLVNFFIPFMVSFRGQGAGGGVFSPPR